MTIFEELKKRDIIAQMTNEEAVKNVLDNKKIKFYMGTDPTASSLHIGHFVMLMMMSRLQKFGHVPIVLFGGATAMVGDPSGKTDMRKMLTSEEIHNNIENFKKQAAKFIDFSDEKAFIVNNADWLNEKKYIDFVREIGVHFTINRMLAAECYKQRLEKGLTLFELNYMIMQSYDFLHLNRSMNCELQIGGDDQWSNIIGGVELVRRMDKKEVYGMTFKLLTTTEGVKMGKTVAGALWLDPDKTSPYDFYQYWRNVEDKKVIECFNMLTYIPIEEIAELSKLKGQEINKAKEILAFEITKLIHGEEEAKKAQDAARSIFMSNAENINMPTHTLLQSDLIDEKIDICTLLVLSELASSKSEARRLIEQGGITQNGEKIIDINFILDINTLKNGVVIKKGKKIYKKINI